MATHTLYTGAQLRATILSAVGSPIGSILSRFDRRQLEAFITIAIDLLDAIDAPFSDAEPAFGTKCRDHAPGDPSDAESDGIDQDVSWPETYLRDIRAPRDLRA